MPSVTYVEIGATADDLPAGYHHLHVERVIGHGRQAFERAADDLLAGCVQRRAGASVRLSETPIREGTHAQMQLLLWPLRFNIPCLVV